MSSGSERRPLLVFLDDLHWADAATLALLAYLVRQPSLAPIGFLAASRPVEPRSRLAAMLQALSRQGALTRLSLGLLGKEDVLAIARRLSPHYAYPLADWLLQTSEGSPYILAELVSHARAERPVAPGWFARPAYAVGGARRAAIGVQPDPIPPRPSVRRCAPRP